MEDYFLSSISLHLSAVNSFSSALHMLVIMLLVSVSGTSNDRWERQTDLLRLYF